MWYTIASGTVEPDAEPGPPPLQGSYVIIQAMHDSSIYLAGFADLPPDARADLASRGRRRRWERGETIFGRSDPPQAVFAITEGLAGMVATTPNGYRRILYLYRPGEIAGARTLMPHAPEANHDLEAITPVEAVEIPRLDLEEMGERHPEILVGLNRQFSRQIQDLGRRLMGVMSVEVRVRLARVLLDLSIDGPEAPDEMVSLSWQLTHRELAQIIGASRPHVSTLLGELEEEGIVERNGQRGLRVRPARLQEIVRDG